MSPTMTPTPRIDGPPARVPIVDAERDNRDTAVLGISVAIMLMAVVVLVGWHAHIRAAVQIFPAASFRCNTTPRCASWPWERRGSVCPRRRRLLVLAGGSFAALMGAAVILEYATGTLIRDRYAVLLPVGAHASAASRADGADHGHQFLPHRRRAGHSRGASDRLRHLRHLNSIPLSLALTSLIGYAFQITYVLPFSLGSQMALHTAAAFLAYGIAMLRLCLEARGARAGRIAHVGGRHRRGVAAGAAGRRQRAVSNAVVAGRVARGARCRSPGSP